MSRWHHGGSDPCRSSLFYHWNWVEVWEQLKFTSEPLEMHWEFAICQNRVIKVDWSTHGLNCLWWFILKFGLLIREIGSKCMNGHSRVTGHCTVKTLFWWFDHKVITETRKSNEQNAIRFHVVNQEIGAMHCVYLWRLKLPLFAGKLWYL